MQVLVVGGRGFIGRAIARMLEARGHAVAVLDRAPDDAPALPSPPDALVFAQGQKSHAPADLEAAHVTATRALLARYAPARAVYLSSGEVYGPDAPLPFDEAQAPDPRTPYSRAKIAGEALLAAYSDDAHRGVSLRLGVVYGPGQTGAMLIPALLEALRNHRDFLMTAGAQTRDFVFVDDVADLVARILETPLLGPLPAVLNGATGLETPVRELALEVARLASAHLGRDVAPHLRLGAQPYRLAEQMRYALSPSLAQATLGWSAPTPLARGLARTVAAALTGSDAGPA